jgi:hypothetical protein
MYNIEDHCDCPRCGYPIVKQYLGAGYPAVGQYFGVYFPGGRCGGCGFVDKIAASKIKSDELERSERVKRLRENPPIFKSVEDWETWSKENEK